MRSPAVPSREDVDQSLDRRHSGVRRRSAAPLRAALAQRGACRQLRAAAAAQRIDANTLRGHLAQDWPFHRDEERQRGRLAARPAHHADGAIQPTPSHGGRTHEGTAWLVAPTVASPSHAPARGGRSSGSESKRYARESPPRERLVAFSRIPSARARRASSRARAYGTCRLPHRNAASTHRRILAQRRGARRIGASSLSIDSASTFLQSMQPHPAVRHCTATCSTVAGGLNALCR